MVDITITSQGKKILEEIKHKLSIWMEQNLDISDQDAEILSKYLDKLRK